MDGASLPSPAPNCPNDNGPEREEIGRICLMTVMTAQEIAAIERAKWGLTGDARIYGWLVFIPARPQGIEGVVS